MPSEQCHLSYEDDECNYHDHDGDGANVFSELVVSRFEEESRVGQNRHAEIMATLARINM